MEALSNMEAMHKQNSLTCQFYFEKKKHCGIDKNDIYKLAKLLAK